MLICGVIIDNPDEDNKERYPVILDTLKFNEDGSIRECEYHESDVMAEYYCDTRGIVLVTELEFKYLNGPGYFITNELTARKYLTDQGYTLKV